MSYVDGTGEAMCPRKVLEHYDHQKHEVVFKSLSIKVYLYLTIIKV